MQDSAHLLQEQVRDALTAQQALRISGGDSKAFYGHRVDGEVLNTLSHTGITSHEPTELTITARAGTLLTEVDSTLAKHGQIIPGEPPQFSSNTTIGGVIAAGLSGPARPFRASIQDTVLGCTLLNGKGEILRFGGKVMKNVAGYDVSRFLTGSLGCLGVVLDVTLKVIPDSRSTMHCVFDIGSKQANAFINDLRRQGLPVTATCQFGNSLNIRFSAGNKEISGIPRLLNQQYSFVSWHEHDDADYWRKLRDHDLPFFNAQKPLWRLSVPADADISELVASSDDLLTEWGGCLHWLKSELDAETIFRRMAEINGQATLFRNTGHDNNERIFQPLSPTLQQWHQELKAAFDPKGLLNYGKMYSDL